MKINEKNLIGFAASNSPVDQEGWLLKRGEINKSFQRRWFVLKGNLLFYFDKKTDKEPIGVIILEGCTIELAENEEQYTFKVVFHGAGDRTYILGSDSQETMESWMKALACASYDYMKLMVCELQRQLDDILEAERAHKLAMEDRQKADEACGGSPTTRTQRQHPLAVAQQPLRRINPFNRCQSEGNVQTLEPSGGNCGVLMPSSAPGTPRVQHQVHYQSPSPSIVKRTEAMAVSMSSPSLAAKTFNELHNRFGEKILRDMRKWQRKQPLSPPEPLIQL